MPQLDKVGFFSISILLFVVYWVGYVFFGSSLTYYVTRKTYKLRLLHFFVLTRCIFSKKSFSFRKIN